MNLTQDSSPKTPLRIFTIGDPHFKESNPGQTQSMTKRIIEIARDKQPDLIICLGDVLDRHAKLHTDPLCEAIYFFRKLADIAHLCIIIGNHDRRTNTDYLTDRHPFTAVKYWDGVTVVDQTKVLHLNGHLITLVPYVWPGRFIEAMDDFFLEEDSESFLASIFGSKFTTKAKDESERYSSAKKIAQKILSSPHLARLLMNKSESISKIKDKSKRSALLVRIILDSWSSPTNTKQQSVPEGDSPTTDAMLKKQDTDLFSLLALRSKFISETIDAPQYNLLETKILPVILSSLKPPSTETEENQNSGTADDPEETEEIEEIVRDYSNRWWWKSSIIFAHQEFKGAKMGAIVSEMGDEWPINGPLIISGHIHDYQKVQENVWYTGTPIQHGFGDTAGKTISFMSWSNPDQGWEEERIDLGLIKRKTVRMGILDLIIWTPPEGFLLKVIISGTPGELKTLPALSKIHYLRRSGIVVTIKTLPDKPLSITNSTGIQYTSVGYLIALWKEVSQNERMKLWYQNIFGGSAHLDRFVSLMPSDNDNLSDETLPIEIGQILNYLLSDSIPLETSGSSSKFFESTPSRSDGSLMSPNLVINSNSPTQTKRIISEGNIKCIPGNHNQPGIFLLVSDSIQS
uniref:DNA repair exonuclease n=1 Tax=Pithovirus LCPAC201 TaxID=2506591 RepID=A0A481Z4V3_9VIRU|nr:MAG: DNA repair exonuclease [Pithovirus LCPAC201]